MRGLFVMPGLVPGIHVLTVLSKKDVDGRDKPGHDGTLITIRSGPVKFNIVKPSMVTVRRPAAIATQFGIALHLTGAQDIDRCQMIFKMGLAKFALCDRCGRG